MTATDDPKADLKLLIELSRAAIEAAEGRTGRFDAHRDRHSAHFEAIKQKIQQDPTYAEAYRLAWGDLGCRA